MADVAKLAVVPIDRTGRPQSKVIEYIEGLLARAAVGEIQSIAVAYACADGASGNGHFYGERPGDYNLIATALLCLQHDFVCELETREYQADPPPIPDDPAA